jgi:ubiquitin-protein ligase
LTHLFEAIKDAADDLIKYFAADALGHARPAARRLILVISDGEDSELGKGFPYQELVTLTERLIRDQIVVDVVLVSTTDENEPLCAVCKLTGGLAFRSMTEEGGIAFFEKEAFLNRTIRDKVAPHEVPLTREEFAAALEQFRSITPYANDALNHGVREAIQQFPLGTLLYGIRWGAKAELPAPEDVAAGENDTGQRRWARILRELKYLKNNMPGDSLDYQAWVNYQRVDRLRVFFRAPPGSPFSGKWWSLYITFPAQYPASPPLFRFVNVPYHPNISAEGRLLFSELDLGYTPDKRIWDLVVATRNLLAAPEVGDALNQVIVLEFQRSRSEYDRKARESADAAGAVSPDWSYTTGQKRGDDDQPPVADEVDDDLGSQPSMTRTKPVPIIINPMNDMDIWD